MEVNWTEFAIQNLKAIFDYYSKKASKKIAHQIRKRILDSTRQLENYPNSGQQELNLEKLNLKHRYVIAGNYKVIYRIEEKHVIVIDIFDTRQDPDKMIDEARKI